MSIYPATLQPLLANNSTIALPKPEFEPVMSSVLFILKFNLKSMPNSGLPKHGKPEITT
jgi:hypothetical protein